MRNVLLILFSVLSLGLSGQSANSLLWEIRSPEGQSSWLFGTYHLVNSGFLIENPRVDLVYQEASTVVVEAVLDSSKLMTLNLQMMMQGRTMRDLLDSADYALVDRELKLSLGLGLALLGNLKPAAISTMYAANLAGQNMPSSLQFSGQPIDLYLADEARKQGKEVIALESMTQQSELLFGSQSLEEQAADLVEVIREKEEAGQITRELIEAYRQEDLAAMAKIATDNGDDLPDTRLFLEDRNRNWLAKLKPRLPQGGLFIAVGALHLCGKEGLIQLLEAEGYQLIPLLPE